MGKSYDDHRDDMRRRMAEKYKAGQDIGDPPDIADIKRRESCRESLRLFCETYNPESFRLGWSDDHLLIIQRIEEAALHGALFAFAMPRGGGKTTICRTAVVWAVAYGHARYGFVIGATAPKAEQTLDSVKMFMRFMPEFGADFPEIAHPVRALGGSANKAGGQHCGGEPTLIQWAKERLVMPRVPCPSNWPDDWPCGPGGMAPTSNSVIGVSGLTGEGIRGSLFALPSGEQLRPDLVLLDDPQTDESAASPSQNNTRERLIGGAVLGMAGPGKSISAVMPCTVIAQDDCMDRMLDRKKHPLWRGERTKMLRTMPKNMGEWEKYFEVYERCIAKEPPDLTEANHAYDANREKLDEGAEASWEDRKLESEVSAVQHAMHLYFRSPIAFAAEYQNEPLAMMGDDEQFLNAEQITQKVTAAKESSVPPRCSRLTGFVDVQKDLLYWMVAAWDDSFGGQVMAYGSYPDQKLGYFTLNSARHTLAGLHPKAGVEGAIYAGLVALLDQLCGRMWPTHDGEGKMRVERLLIDAGWGESRNVVFDACRDTPHAGVVNPSFGRGIKAGDRPMIDWKREPGEEIGHDWRRRTAKGEGVRYVLFDANTWKTFVHRRLAVPIGDRGSLALFKAAPVRHRMLSEHLTAEHPTRTTGREREVIEWKHVDKTRDNHLFDCLAGAAVAASTLGVSTEGHKQPPRRKAKVKLSALQRR